MKSTQMMQKYQGKICSLYVSKTIDQHSCADSLTEMSEIVQMIKKVHEDNETGINKHFLIFQ